MLCVYHSAQEGVIKMENEFELDEEYPEMSDAQARDVYNDISLYMDGYIYPWIK